MTTPPLTAESPADPILRDATPVMVSARDVSKVYDDRAVLQDINVNIREGELYGIVGPSGCGKTTLIRVLIGLAIPSGGEVRVSDVEPEHFKPKDRRQIGYLPQEFSLYPTLTVMQNARFIASIYGVGWFRRRRRIRELLTFLELWDARHRLAQDLSGGMRRRLGLTTALIHHPRLLVVDEPTAGLDPDLRARIWAYLEEIQRSGTTIILSTQYIEEAERCDRVAIMGAGRIIAEGTPDNLRERAGVPDTLFVDVDGRDSGDLGALWNLPGVREVRPVEDGRILVRASESDQLIPQITEVLTERGRDVQAIEVNNASFEDVFMLITRRT